MTKKTVFSDQLLQWFDHHGRKNLPWQRPITPYRTWVSEIMLQQTQVDTVIPYFLRFLKTFPTVEALANAPQDEVLHLWTGLGYYARARNLHKCAQIISQELYGVFPQDIDSLAALPGIGPSTAAAISSIAFNQPTAILDGNVKRVLARIFAVHGWPGNKKVENLLWQHAHSLMPQTRCNDYTQAIMDLGATLCTRARPKCESCPVMTHCQSFAASLQHTLPEKKPKKKIPTKDICMLLIRNQVGQVLLEKRAQTGIWGGLWSLPESDTETDAQANLIHRFGRPLTTHSFAKIKHTFSHYHLQIHALTAQLDKTSSQQIMDTEHNLWYNLDDPQALGLAAPVKKLLSQIQTHHSQFLDTP